MASCVIPVITALHVIKIRTTQGHNKGKRWSSCHIWTHFYWSNIPFWCPVIWCPIFHSLFWCLVDSDKAASFPLSQEYLLRIFDIFLELKFQNKDYQSKILGVNYVISNSRHRKWCISFCVRLSGLSGCNFSVSDTVQISSLGIHVLSYNRLQLKVTEFRV